MKSIIDYINENLQFINESFECDVLKRADSSIKKLQKEQNDYYKEMYGDTTYVRKLQSIKDVFSWIPGVELSKVTNDMVSEANPSDKETIEEIEAHEKSFNPDEQNMLLSQSNIYLDPEGAYQVPQLDQFSQSMSNRIDMIRDNMYTLPTAEEVKQIPQNQDNQMIQAIYFLDDSKIKEEE